MRDDPDDIYRHNSRHVKRVSLYETNLANPLSYLRALSSDSRISMRVRALRMIIRFAKRGFELSDVAVYSSL